MRVSVASDIHLEFSDCVLPGGDVLILAGDTWTYRQMRPSATDQQSHAMRKRYDRFCAEELSKYRRVLMVTGNHESYGDIIDEMNETIRWFLSTRAPHAQLLCNETAVIDGWPFLGTPLWSTCGVGHEDSYLKGAIGGGMNDFRLIRTNWPLPMTVPGRFDTKFVGKHRTLTVYDADEIHRIAVDWLKTELPKHEKCIVIGHHAPSMLSAAKGDRFRHFDPDMNLGYCSELDQLIVEHPQIFMWVHGHTHRREDYTIGLTKIVANPRGYPSERVYFDFSAAASDYDVGEIL